MNLVEKKDFLVKILDDLKILDIKVLDLKTKIEFWSFLGMKFTPPYHYVH